MPHNPPLPGNPALPAIPERTLPLGAVLFVLLALLLLPGPVLFIAGCAAAIGCGITVADWRRAPDAPPLNGPWSA